MNTMKGFNITQLQYYYDNRISFKCIDILKWAKANLSNNDFNIKYAAQDLMSHYFIRSYRRPNNDCFYYICENEFSKNLYKIERDYIMSPITQGKGKDVSLIKKLQKDSDNIITKILSSNNCTEWERKYITYINNVYRKRIFTITEGDSDILYTKYYKYSKKQKNQIYSIVKDRLKDLQTLLYIFKRIEVQSN